MTSQFSKHDARPLRVAFINTHPIQYFAPLYAYLNKTGNFDVTALYLSDFSLRGGLDRGFGQSVTWDLDLLAGYTVQFMGDAAKRRRIDGFLSMVAPELWRAIRYGNFDAVVIHGHNLAAHHVALAAARSSGTPVFHRSDTHLGLQRPTWKQSLRTPILKAWYRAFDGFLAIGSANKRYYEAMGVSPSKIFSMPYTVDNDRFISAASEGALPYQRMRTRELLGLSSNAPAILYAAKFDQRKRPDDLLEAFRCLLKEGLDAQLVLVGSGDLEAKLKRLVHSETISRVTFPGFINQSELPRVYAACDLFVLPSENEPWGLAVNEAMCASLPIVLSAGIGCAEDLVESGINGAIFPAGDTSQLVAALRSLIINPTYRASAGGKSLERIRQWSYSECSAGLISAISSTRKHDVH